MDFDPRLRAGEISGAPDFAPGDDVKAERALLVDVDTFAFCYPLWLDAPPAMMKGYLDRVFGRGFAYGQRGEESGPLLKGRSMISFTSSGAPTDWIRSTGAWDALSRLVDSYFGELTGLAVVEHVHFGSVGPGMRPDAVERLLARVRDAVIRHFPS
jgi:NAD(P)H dehydrogenase (quinone)